MTLFAVWTWQLVVHTCRFCFREGGLPSHAVKLTGTFLSFWVLEKHSRPLRTGSASLITLRGPNLGRRVALGYLDFREREKEAGTLLNMFENFLCSYVLMEECFFLQGLAFEHGTFSCIVVLHIAMWGFCFSCSIPPPQPPPPPPPPPPQHHLTIPTSQHIINNIISPSPHHQHTTHRHHQHIIINTSPSSPPHQQTTSSHSPSTQHHEHNIIISTPSTQHHQHNIMNTTSSDQHHQHNTIKTPSSTHHHHHHHQQQQHSTSSTQHHQHNIIYTTPSKPTPSTEHHQHIIINTSSPTTHQQHNTINTPSTQNHDQARFAWQAHHLEHLHRGPRKSGDK